MGLLPSSSGRIRMDDLDLLAQSDYRRAHLGIGFMPEDRRLVPNLSVEENILLPTWATGLSSTDERLQWIVGLMPEVGEFRQRPASALSGGQQKLVALARALMIGTDILLLDEPTEGIAPILAKRMLDVLTDLKGAVYHRTRQHTKGAIADMPDSQTSFVPAGVIPATLLAFDNDFSINWQETIRHLRDVADTDGISAITVNGHASEVHACSFDEQQEILERSIDAIGDRVPIIGGIYADGSLEAARLARMSQAAGAAALLVFPSNALSMGGQMRPEMAEAHFKTVADASDLPLICFNYARWTNLNYPLETLLRLFETIPSIRAIKDWTASLTMGCNGLLSGSGSIIPELQVALFRAVQAGNLQLAQQLNDQIRPLSQAFYAQPFLDMHNRMKEAAVLLGRQHRAVVRPPLQKLSAGEIDVIADALVKARLLPSSTATVTGITNRQDQAG